MTRDEARDRMGAALDGELTSVEQGHFDLALSQHPDLRAEYENLEEIVRETRRLRNVPAPADLLQGVQQRLRERSAGRFYRDKFAESRGQSKATTWMIVLAATVLMFVVAWFALSGGTPRLHR